MIFAADRRVHRGIALQGLLNVVAVGEIDAQHVFRTVAAVGHDFAVYVQNKGGLGEIDGTQGVQGGLNIFILPIPLAQNQLFDLFVLQPHELDSAHDAAIHGAALQRADIGGQRLFQWQCAVEFGALFFLQTHTDTQHANQQQGQAAVPDDVVVNPVQKLHAVLLGGGLCRKKGAIGPLGFVTGGFVPIRPRWPAPPSDAQVASPRPSPCRVCRRPCRRLAARHG